MVFGLASCKELIEEKIVEGITEELIEEIEDVSDISIDSSNEGKITISDGENTMVIEGNEDGMPWPDDKFPSNIPKLVDVKVVSIADTGTGILLGFEECAEDEALAYIEQIEEAGWNILMNMSDDAGGMIQTNNDAGESLLFVWDTEEQGGAITYSSAP